MPKFWNEMFERVVGPALDLAYRQGYEDGLAARADTEPTTAPAVEKCTSRRIDSADATHVHECRCPRNTHRYSPIAGSIHECEWCDATWSHEISTKVDGLDKCGGTRVGLTHVHECGRSARTPGLAHEHACDACPVTWVDENGSEQ